jgi:predicted transport protein
MALLGGWISCMSESESGSIMPLFNILTQPANVVETTEFESEKALQKLIESSLQTVFNCRFVATEFITGSLHGGRIDTLALSEDSNPVIIEYKTKPSSELVNQSLFYLHWIKDHKGDFAMAVTKSLGNVEVDWSDVRVICIAPSYKRYDLHAVQVMGANIELWTYRRFKNSTLLLEELFGTALLPSTSEDSPEALTPGKKAALTKATGSYTFEQHLKDKPDQVVALALAVHDFILGLDPAITEAPKKFYIAYKLAQNIACMQLMKKQIVLYLKLDPKQLGTLPPIARDSSSVGHFGTGDLEVNVATHADLEAAKPFIQLAYQKAGG